MTRVTNQSKYNIKGIIGELLEKKILITRNYQWIIKSQNGKTVKFLNVIFSFIHRGNTV